MRSNDSQNFKEFKSTYNVYQYQIRQEGSQKYCFLRDCDHIHLRLFLVLLVKHAKSDQVKKFFKTFLEQINQNKEWIEKFPSKLLTKEQLLRFVQNIITHITNQEIQAIQFLSDYHLLSDVFSTWAISRFQQISTLQQLGEFVTKQGFPVNHQEKYSNFLQVQNMVMQECNGQVEILYQTKKTKKKQSMKKILGFISISLLASFLFWKKSRLVGNKRLLLLLPAVPLYFMFKK